MIQIIRYQCELCKKEFRTPNRHYCKNNPELKNCFSCKHLDGWDNNDRDYPNYPVCLVNEEVNAEWDINTIKQVNYNMQCEKWESK